jgi:hypothetical protein
MHSLLHVSVHLDHPQGAYADPCYSHTFVELSVKYIVKSFALLWQHVFQAVVCVPSAVQSVTDSLTFSVKKINRLMLCITTALCYTYQPSNAAHANRVIAHTNRVILCIPIE